MRVLGIDLSPSARKSGACVLECGEGALRASVSVDNDDERLFALAEGCEKVAIDAPFGWPDGFIDPVGGAEAFDVLRETDRLVMHTRQSPGPELIAARLRRVAMRCSLLLDLWSADAPLDRTGGGRFVEVYPPAAMQRWGLKGRGYRFPDTAAPVDDFAALREQLPELEIVDGDEICEQDDDAFDSVVAALVARAVALGLTDAPHSTRRMQAAQEGWIHLPVRGSLPFLSREPGDDLERVALAQAGVPPPRGAQLAHDAFSPFADGRDDTIPIGEQRFAGRVKLGSADDRLGCLVDGDAVLAVVSKGAETFASRRAAFATATSDAMALADPTWNAEFLRLCEDPSRYRHLDAAELVETYRDLRIRFRGRSVTLAYLYWAPRNADDVLACAVHVAEVAELTRCVDDAAVRFVAVDYPTLWSQWSTRGNPAWLRRHAESLRDRYDVVV